MESLRHQEPPPTTRPPQRSLVSLAIALVTGSALLAATVRVDSDSAAFTVLAVLLAATWIAGAAAAGPIALQPRADIKPAVAIVGGAAAGTIAFLGFAGAAVIARHLPFADDAVERVLDTADEGQGWLVLCVALVNGCAEELFFRGALHDALRARRPLVTVTIVYVAVTAATGNVALVVAAVGMGLILELERIVTGGVLVPIITHVTWSTLMLLALPH